LTAHQSLNNKIVVITGAGSGLGRELAKAFCAAGAVVVGVGRTISKVEETAALITEGSFEPYALDVSDFLQVKDCFDSVVKKHGRIDILFNNAAVYPKINFLEETAEQWGSAVAINLSGVANCSKVVLPGMINQDYGRIFNVSSWAHLGPIANSAVYSCTKGAVHSLTKAIAADLAHLNKNIEVHEWIPGHLNTQMSDYTGIEPSLSASWAVEIALKPDSPSKSCIYEQNWEWKPPKSLKQKIKAKLFFWR